MDAYTLFHTTAVNAPSYRLQVDVWMNFSVLTASTEFAHIGVGGNGTTFNSIFTPISGSGSFIAFTGDGGSASDFRWYRDAANTPVGDLSSGTLPNTHPSHLGNGSNNTNAFFLDLFPLGTRPAPAVAGVPGNMWTTLTIDVDNVSKLISYSFDGTKTFEGAFDGEINGRVSLGINDPFTSVDAGSVFTLYDNLTVTAVPEPSASLLCLAALAMGAFRRSTPSRAIRSITSRVP